MTETSEIRTTALPALEVGEIWATQNLGVFVVVSSRPARWHGEDIDVYAHIDTWYTIRPATEAESALWSQAVAAATARREQRKALKGEYLVFSETTGELCPTPEATRRLDSYDDRWEPPSCIHLTPQQVIIERAYLQARAALKGHGLHR